jgi:phosphatidylglycerol---prolipoprotein diacylglyceryl transferase
MPQSKRSKAKSKKKKAGTGPRPAESRRQAAPTPEAPPPGAPTVEAPTVKAPTVKAVVAPPVPPTSVLRSGPSGVLPVTSGLPAQITAVPLMLPQPGQGRPGAAKPVPPLAKQALTGPFPVVRPVIAALPVADAKTLASLKPTAMVTGQAMADAKPAPRAKATVPAQPAGPAKLVPDEPAEDEAAEDEAPRWAAKALESLLVVNCWLDPGERGEPFTTTVRFTGQRTDVAGRLGPGDTFTQDEGYKGIVPGSGPVAVTAEVRGVNPGTWAVTARPLPHDGTPAPKLAAPGRVPVRRLIVVPAVAGATVRTTTLLRSKVPGITRYAYGPLCVIGVLVGLVLEGLLLANGRYPVLAPVGFSVAAVAAGVAGGKAWYGAVHQWRTWDGWCIQGFVAGAAVVVAAVAVVGPGLPAGAFLAAATPALLIGMGIGRHACFVAGCCTGRPTASRWGIWSSDRRLGCRRMPVQLYEAWTALVVGGASLATVLVAGLARSGPVAVIALAAYTLVRQGILGLRDEPRAWRYGRPLTASLSFLALVAGVLLFAL